MKLAIVAFLVLAAALGVVLAAGRAEAHALLQQSDPPVNARLQEPPTRVSALFTEPLDTRLSSMRVLDGTGERVSAPETTFGPEANRMSTEIPQALSPGFYTVIWETLSAVDGHLFKGSYPFTVLNEDGSEPSGPRFEADVGGYSPKASVIVAKWVSLVASSLLVGSLAFAAWVVRPASKEAEGALKTRVRNAARRHMSWLSWSAALVLVPAGAAELLLKASDIGGLNSVGDVLETDWGEHWIQRQITLGIILVALFAAGRLWGEGRSRLSESAVWVALAAGLVYQLLVAMVSHGGAIPGSAWAIGADLLHLVSTSVWIGMLAALALLIWWALRETEGEDQALLLASHLQRFSVLAATSVVILLSSGVFNALAQIPTWGSLVDTAYGRSLLVKLVIVAGLLVVAGANAFILRPRTVDEEPDPGHWSRRLSVAVRIEAGVAVAVLLAAAVLIQYPTSRVVEDARAAEEAQQEPQAVIGFEGTQDFDDFRVSLTISPNAVGTNAYRVFLLGNVGEVTQVRLRFRAPDPELAPSEIIAEPVGPDFPNQYRAVGPFFVEPGPWEVQVDLRRRDVDDVSAIFQPQVAGSILDTGGRFDFPLTVGSWAAVGAAGAMLLALLMGIWAAQWPDLPQSAPRYLRIGSAAVMVVAAGSFAIALLPNGEAQGGNPIEADAASIAIGRTIFMANCAQCHGETGEGNGPLAPTLEVPPANMRQHVPFHSDQFFFDVITLGIGDLMPAWEDTLSEDERWHVINFLRSEFGTSTTTPAQEAGQ